MEITPAVLRNLRTSFKGIFNGTFEGVTPTWNTVAMEVPSTTKSNTYGWMSKIPGFREWVGDRVVNNISAKGYTIDNRAYELTIAVDRDDIEDDNLGVYNPLFAEFGRSAAEHPDELVWGLLASGFNTPCWDGQYFFDTDHPVTDANGVTQSVSNFQGGAGTAWYLIDDTRAVKPLVYQNRRAPTFVALDNPDDPNVFSKKEFVYGVDKRCAVGFGLWQLAYASKQTLDATNLWAAKAAMATLKGDAGRLLGVRPSLLVVPSTLEEKARTLLNATDIGGTSNVLKGAFRLHVESRLG